MQPCYRNNQGSEETSSLLDQDSLFVLLAERLQRHGRPSRIQGRERVHTRSLTAFLKLGPTDSIRKQNSESCYFV